MKILIEKEINPQDDKYCGECEYQSLKGTGGRYYKAFCSMFYTYYMNTFLEKDENGCLRCDQCIKSQRRADEHLTTKK